MMVGSIWTVTHYCFHSFFPLGFWCWNFQGLHTLCCDALSCLSCGNISLLESAGVTFELLCALLQDCALKIVLSGMLQIAEQLELQFSHWTEPSLYPSSFFFWTCALNLAFLFIMFPIDYPFWDNQSFTRTSCYHVIHIIC